MEGMRITRNGEPIPKEEIAETLDKLREANKVKSGDLLIFPQKHSKPIRVVVAIDTEAVCYKCGTTLTDLTVNMCMISRRDSKSKEFMTKPIILCDSCEEGITEFDPHCFVCGGDLIPSEDDMCTLSRVAETAAGRMPRDDEVMHKATLMCKKCRNADV